MARRRKVYVHDFLPVSSVVQRQRRMGMTATVQRRYGHSKRLGYEACVSFAGRHPHARAGPRTSYRQENYMACAYGPAPRRALGAALKKLGATLVRRSSAFRGT